MFFHWLKRYMPRSLYGRAALILLLPVVFLQLVVSVLFTQRHFEDVTNQMSDSVVREVRLVLDTLAAGSDLQSIAQLQIDTAPQSETALSEPDQLVWYDFSGRIITRRLKSIVPEIRVVDLGDDKTVRLVVATDDGPYALTFDRRRMSASNPHQLFVNMVFFSILITVVSLIYLRNQLRPIKRLADASEAFGRGRHVPYSPTGSTEVRAAGTAFVDMRARIERQIETRTLMLSGVSHDLRTPLTRMRLGLSMMDDEDAAPMLEDVEEMNRMIDAFLNFSRGASEGEPEPLDPAQLAEEAVADAQRAGQNVKLHEMTGTGIIALRRDAIRRALDNLISNGVRYGNRVELSVQLTEKSLRFRVEDAGPGIPEKRREEAVRPFSRLDPARNQDRGSGAGLGLAIATDIARAHGGVLRLGHSDRMGGLQADIVIAR